jgi:protein required for attachment to host cells
MKHPRTWYVVTDGGRARILQKRDAEDAFDTYREFVSANIHRHTHELGTERPGRTHESASSAHHAVQPRNDLHRTDKRNFVYEVATALNEANTRDEFDRLILAAPAHALGELNHALDAPTQRKIAAQLQKDLTNVPNADLAKHFANLSDA